MRNFAQRTAASVSKIIGLREVLAISGLASLVYGAGAAFGAPYGWMVAGALFLFLGLAR
jgi:hypothetical protein